MRTLEETMRSEGFKGLLCPPLRCWAAATNGKSKIICYLCHPAPFLTPVSCFQKRNNDQRASSHLRPPIDGD